MCPKVTQIKGHTFILFVEQIDETCVFPVICRLIWIETSHAKKESQWLQTSAWIRIVIRILDPERNPDHPQILLDCSLVRETPLINVSCISVHYFVLSVDPALRHGIDAALGQRLVFALIVFKIVHLHVYPSDTRRWAGVVLMLGQRRRRWTNIRAALVRRLVSAGWLVSTVDPISRVSYIPNLLFYRPL